MKLKMSLIHLFWLVISAGIFRYMTSGPNLIWNMFLALVALDFAYLTYRTKNTFVKLVGVLLWLLFYPNTFYMLTDIIHMSFAGQALWDRSSMIMFMLYVSSILFGVLSGVLSLQLIFNSLGVKNIYLRYLVIGNLSFLSSFAIHIGRYARLNSWDALTNPMTVVNSMVDVVSWSALPFIAGFTFLQMMTLIFLDRE
ncbi:MULTISPECIES: DUF1361 domain-containing protein [unclassified Streptococcus]|uniref:DUF1361 domain-containing protein n=1 Tax=unclassified Streptococcus TaxID=2608887 RepID=UPI0011B6CCDD|nr:MULTISPECIES: DUF1361 domain-containing protein [unclassified Streptococcus]TWS94042.1 DUF1361 domain-containing protein [Streptococcus sp. sy018]TWT14263.1 DUF1361 domain-containing protein [Streptococcus sp. sy010]